MTDSEGTGEATQASPKLNFIRDVAASVDFFGSHDRVAEAIASVISNNNDLKVIGLLGSWGSGKSTVVRHVQKHLNRLDDDDGIKTHVFCYDAWLHQSDPPRRSFLETFVAFLVSEKLTTQERWQLQLDILNRQVEDTETTSTPTLTPGGIWLLLSFALIPIGMQLIGNPWYVAASKVDADWFARCAFYIGWGILATPILIAVLIKLFGKHDGSLLSLFINRQVHRQVNRVTRNPDPTTIEFQGIFRAIIAALPEGKRLIFVIDNLDRLHETEAVAMWNTIRSFFLGKEHSDRSTRSSALPTVLLPIDQDAVERIYSKDHGQEIGKRLARSFLDKTFDLSFHVTPPVLSDWNLYLASQLKHVFGDSVDPAWAYQVGRLYEVHSRNGHEITPRAINVVINDIATLWLQWGDEVPFVTIAYFVVFREQVESDIFVAVNKPIVSISDLDADWQRGLAALHYGAPQAKAIQVLIEPRLRKAFDDWEADEFKELAALPGFPETLQRVLDSARPARPPLIAQGAYLLSELAPDPAPWVSAAWSSLRNLYAHGQPYESIDESDSHAVKLMLANCPPSLLPGFIREVSVRLSQVMEPAFVSDPAARNQYVEMITALVDTAREHELQAPSVIHLGGADTYLETLKHAADKPEIVRAIRFAGADQQLVDTLATQMTAVGAGPVEAKFNALRHKKIEVNWDGLIEASRRFLAEQPGTTAGTFTAGGILGRFWKESEKAKKAVRDLADNGVLNARIGETYHPQRYARMAQLVALAILDERPLDQPAGNAWETVIKTEPTLPERVRTAMDKFDDTGTTHRLVKVSQQSPHALALCRAIVTRRVELRELGPLYIEQILNELPDYLNCIAPERQRSFVVQLTSYASFWTSLAERKFDENTRRILKALATTDAASGTVQRRAQKLLKAHLQAVSEAAWKVGVQTNVEPIPITKALALVSKQAPNAGQNLFEALKSLLPSLVTDNVPDWGARWFEAATFLSPASRKAAHRYLRDRIFSGSATAGLPTLLGLANDQFFADADFASVGDSTLRHVVAPMLNSETALNWLSKNAALVKTWVDKAPDDARAFLKEQVQHRSGEVDDVMRKRLKAIAADWGL
jgi:hypothetical protein